MRLKELFKMRVNCIEQMQHDQDFIQRGLGGVEALNRFVDNQRLLIAINAWIVETIEHEEKFNDLVLQ